MCYLLHQYFASLLERKLLLLFYNYIKVNYRRAHSIFRSKLIASKSIILVKLCFERKALCLGGFGEELYIYFRSFRPLSKCELLCSPGITGPRDACTFSSIFPYLCLISSTLSVKRETSILNAQNREINHSLYIFFGMVSSQRTCCLFYI